MKEILYILVISSIFLGKINARTYYISTTGNNANDGLSTVKSWRTLTYASGSTSPVIAGDTVFVKAGDYGAEFVEFEKIGKASDPIVYQGYKTTPGDLPVLNYTIGAALNSTLMPLYNGGDRANGKIGFNLIDKSYITINNFQITNYEYGITTGNGHHLILNNINVMYLGDISNSYSGNGIQLGLTGTAWSNNNSVTNCLIVNSAAEGLSINGHYNTITNNKVYCNEGLIGSGNNSATDYYILINGNYNSIVNCYTERVGNLGHYGHGIGLKYNCQNNTITKCKSVNMSECFYVRHTGVKYNKFYNCSSVRGDSYAVRDGASNNTFVDCVSDSADAGFLFFDTSEDGGAKYAGRNNVFKNCIIKNANYGVSFDNYNQVSPVDSNIIANCTFYNINYLFRSNKQNSENKIINCLISNVKNLSIGTYSISVKYYNSNFYGTGFSNPIGTNIISLNPLCVNPLKGDFRLLSSSPCINSGTNLPYVTNDFDGTPRPQQNGYDIGAFEYRPSIVTGDQSFDFQTNQLNVYPNPTYSTITVITNCVNDKITIYDMLGKELLSVISVSNINEINLDSFTDGIYYIKVGDHLSTKIFKLSN